jgi:hypothetical protein
MLITIDQADIAEWHGAKVPAEARLFASRDFIASDGTFVERGSAQRGTGFYQTFPASLVGDKIRIGAGQAYATTNALDDDGLTTYTLAIFDADGSMLTQVRAGLRVPHDYAPAPLTWSQVDAFSQAKRTKQPSTYLSSQAILQILSGYVTSVIKASSVAIGITKLDTAPADIANPVAVGSNSPVLVNPATTGAIGHTLIDKAPVDPAVPVAVGTNSDLLVALDVPPAVPGDLVGVGVNSPLVADGLKVDIERAGGGTQLLIRQPQVKAVKDKYKHLSSFASLASAAADAAADPGNRWILTVDETPTLNNTTHPPNLYLDFGKEYGLNMTPGNVANINPYINAPKHRIFTGDTGQVRLQRHPGAQLIDAVHWLPDGSGSAQAINTSMSEALRTSQNNNRGSTLLLPLGHFTVDHNAFRMYHGTLSGAPADGDASDGTVLELLTSGTAPVRVMQGARFVFIEKLAIRAEDAVTTAQAVLLTGQAGVDPSMNTVIFRELKMYGFEDQIKCVSTGGNYGFDKIIVEATCSFINYSHSGFYLDSVNSSYFVDSDNFSGKWNGLSVCCYLPGGGTGEVRGHGRGRTADTMVPPTVETEQFEIAPAAVDPATNIITAVAHGLSTGDMVRTNCPSGTDADLPTASNFSFAGQARAFWRTIDVDHGTLHVSAEGSFGGGGVVDITAIPTANWKIWSNRPKASIANQRPLACFHVIGNHGAGGLKITDWQDEGMPWFMIFESYFGTNNYAPAIFLDRVSTQGQILMKGSCEITAINSVMPVDGIQDEFGVQSRVHLYNMRPLTFGVGGDVYNRAGLKLTAPFRYDSFSGYSAIRCDDNSEDGFTVGGYGNDIPLFRIRSHNYASQAKLEAFITRLGSGIKAAWFKVWTTLDEAVTPLAQGGFQYYAGFAFGGALSRKGRLLNELAASPVTVTPGALTLDLSKNDHFIAGPLEDAAINFTNANIAHGQEVTLLIKTVGAVSFNLTAGANTQLNSTIATGTVAGTYIAVRFYYDATENKLIEYR